MYVIYQSTDVCSASYVSQAIRHVRQLLSTELAQTACRIDYCDAVLCTMHRLAPSRNCSQLRTMKLRLCSRRRDDPMPSRYCTSCIGCQSSSGSHTSWQFWRAKFTTRPLRFTYIAKSWNMPAAELYIHLLSRCWSNHSPGETFPSVFSSSEHDLSGTHC